MSNELELIRRAQSGSAEAFSELISGYRQGLFRFLLVRCLSYADAEDILQDTFINAYRYIKTYNKKWRFSTWLYRIAIRNAASFKTTDTNTAEDQAIQDDDPLAHCIAQSESDNLWRSAKRLLTEEVYSAMWLRYVEDMSVSEISGVLDRSKSWTKVNLLRGRRALEAEMNAKPEQPRSERYG